MIAYVAFRVFTTLLVMPMAGSLSSGFGLYSLAILTVAILATVMSMTMQEGYAAILAALVGTAAVCCFVFVSRGEVAAASQSDFKALVIPEIVFSFAMLLKWRSSKGLGSALHERG